MRHSSNQRAECRTGHSTTRPPGHHLIHYPHHLSVVIARALGAFEARDLKAMPAIHSVAFKLVETFDGDPGPSHRILGMYTHQNIAAMTTAAPGFKHWRRDRGAEKMVGCHPGLSVHPVPSQNSMSRRVAPIQIPKPFRRFETHECDITMGGAPSGITSRAG